MKTLIYTILCCLLIFCTSSFLYKNNRGENNYTAIELKKIYSSGDKTNWPKALVDSSVIGFVELDTLPNIKFPNNNPYSRAKEKLGKSLFFDPRLSISNQISCASCHEPQLGWGDGKRISNGNLRQQGTRNSKTIINSAFANSVFWDGRAGSLEDQVHFALENPIEMNTPREVAVEKIKKIEAYRKLFEEAFNSRNITFDKITKAIATYERTVISSSSKFDKFLKGDSTALTNQEVLGLHLFRTKAKCINCHYGSYFSDQKFHEVGLSYYGRKYEDLGLYNITGKNEDVSKFKTPTLREVSKTGPWMHNGLFPSLKGIINMYNFGMPTIKRKEHQLNDSLFPVKSPLLHKLNLSNEEKEAVIAFLKTLESRTSSRIIAN